MRLKNISLFALIFLICTNQANAKYVYEYLENIEKHLLNSEYNQANEEFENLGDHIKNHAVSGNTVNQLYKDTVKWLTKIECIQTFLNKANENKSLYKADGDYGISRKNCQNNDCEYYTNFDIKNGLPKSLPFSQSFVDYVNKQQNDTLNMFSSLNKSLNDISNQEKANNRQAILDTLEKKETGERLKQEAIDKEKKSKL